MAQILRCGAALLPMIGVELTRGSRRWARTERTVHFIWCGTMTILTYFALGQLVYLMVSKSPDRGGLTLLSSSIALWLINVVNNAILYWQLDRGGPEARSGAGVGGADWLFPQYQLAERFDC